MVKNRKRTILTLVEWKSKYLYAAILSGKNAEETKNSTIQLLRDMTAYSITFDNGKEFAKHEEKSRKLKCVIYFAPINIE